MNDIHSSIPSQNCKTNQVTSKQIKKVTFSALKK